MTFCDIFPVPFYKFMHWLYCGLFNSHWRGRWELSHNYRPPFSISHCFALCCCVIAVCHVVGINNGKIRLSIKLTPGWCHYILEMFHIQKTKDDAFHAAHRGFDTNEYLSCVWQGNMRILAKVASPVATPMALSTEKWSHVCIWYD